MTFALGHVTKMAARPNYDETNFQGCGNPMPDFSDTGNFDDGQVEFSCWVVYGQVNIWGWISMRFGTLFCPKILWKRGAIKGRECLIYMFSPSLGNFIGHENLWLYDIWNLALKYQ